MLLEIRAAFAGSNSKWRRWKAIRDSRSNTLEMVMRESSLLAEDGRVWARRCSKLQNSEIEIFMRFFAFLPLLFFSTFHAHSQMKPLEVGPGLTISSAMFPWALEQYQGKAQLVPIHHSTVEVNHHTGANVAGALTQGVFYKPKMTTELKGLHARSHLHSTSPTFYLFHEEEPDSSGDSEKSATSVWAITRAVPEKDRRTILQIRYAQFTSHAKRQAGVVETKLDDLGDGWTRITPIQALGPGEYVLTRLSKRDDLFETVVYDFSVDPDAPNDKDAVQSR